MMRHSRHGMFIVEFLIIVSIICILAAVLIPGFVNASHTNKGIVVRKYQFNYVTVVNKHNALEEVLISPEEYSQIEAGKVYPLSEAVK